MVRLDLHHYEAIVAVTEEGGVTAAAKRLNVSQSAVSHRIAEAERRLGERLFDRRPARPIRLTAAAEGLYQSAAKALAELDQAETGFLQAEGQNLEVVRLGVGSYDCYHWLPDFHRWAATELSGLIFQIVAIGDTPVAMLNAGEVDVILAIGQPEGRSQSVHLFDDELVFVVNPEHELAERDYTTAEDVKAETYFTYSPNPAPGFEYDRFFRPAGISPRVTMVIEHTSAITEMVAAGQGVAILSRWAVNPWLESGRLKALRCGPEGLELSWLALVRPDLEPYSLEMTVANALSRWAHQSSTESATPKGIGED